MFLELDQNVGNELGNVVRVSLDESAKSENSGVEVRQLDLVLGLLDLLELVLLAASHLRADLRPEILEEASLRVTIEELGVHQTAKNF